MRYLLLLFLLLISLSVNGTAFTIGTGEYWRDICSGKHDELDEKGSIAACTIFLLGYQMGAVEQARESNIEPSLCRSLNPNTLPADFIIFVSSKKDYEKMDVLGVLLEFARGNKCNA